jgi:anthranilate phosphoribosyltransferase
MNLLGPLTNPAGARRQVVGVSHAGLLELIAGALHTLGHQRALVVHGHPGMDEFSPLGPTDVIELRDGELRRYSLDPSSFGWGQPDESALAGGDPAENARAVLDVLERRVGGVARGAVTLNAGAAIYVAGLAPTLEEAVALAEAALDAGKGLETLRRLEEASREVATIER